MKRALAFALAAIGIGWAFEHTAVGCFVRGQHDPRRARTPLGGFRCSRCGKAGYSLDDYDESGHVSPGARPVWDRDGGGGRGSLTRTTELPH